eukprot:418702-Pelagomonas_calceolata.AAC.5
MTCCHRLCFKTDSICACVMAICILPPAALADGTAKLLDLECGLHSQMIDLNPNGYTTEKEWKMVNSVEVSTDLKAIICGDSDGRVHILLGWREAFVHGPFDTRCDIRGAMIKQTARKCKHSL